MMMMRSRRIACQETVAKEKSPLRIRRLGPRSESAKDKLPIMI
jgi:hypothetical protein